MRLSGKTDCTPNHFPAARRGYTVAAMNSWLHQMDRVASLRLRPAWGWAALVLAGMLFFPTAGMALTTVQRSFEELVSLADHIVIGTVTGRQSVWRDPVQQRGIITQITLSDLELLKGEHSAANFVLEVTGGQIGPYGEAVGGLPQLAIGQRYVIFVRGNTQSIFPVVGIEQGVLTVRVDTGGQARVYTFNGLPLTTLEQIATPARALADAPALSLDSVRLAVERVLEELPGAAP